MSVIVRGMEMPIMCTDCNLNYYGQGDDYANCYCSITDKEIDYVARHPDCPLEEADDGWIPYTGQHIENGRYLVQIETGIIVCGTYSEHGFVFPFCSDVIEAFRPLPKPYEPKEDK